VSPTDLSCFTDSLQNLYRRALLLIDNRQFAGFLHKQVRSICRHEFIVIYCALMKHQALLTIQAKLKLAIKLIFFFLLFGRDTIWRIARKRVARGGKL